MSLAISLFITILMIYNGFQGIDPNKIKLAQTFGATKGQVLTKVVLPGSIPTLIAALKVNVGLSMVGVVVGEFQSANIGLGLDLPVVQSTKFELVIKSQDRESSWEEKINLIKQSYQFCTVDEMMEQFLLRAKSIS